MLVFPDPRRGARVRAPRSSATSPSGEPVEGERVRVRMGMHAGEAIREEGDFFGRSVILAARIAAQARGGEILVSEALKRARRGRRRRRRLGFDDGRELELKGLAGTHRVYRADWAGADGGLTPVSQRTGLLDHHRLAPAPSVMPASRRSGITRSWTMRMSQSLAIPAASICSIASGGNQSIVAQESAERKIRSA